MVSPNGGLGQKTGKCPVYMLAERIRGNMGRWRSCDWGTKGRGESLDDEGLAGSEMTGKVTGDENWFYEGDDPWHKVSVCSAT